MNMPKKECCEASEKAKAAKASLASGTADAALASGTVHLYVKGARGLPDMDPAWGSGHSDAFVKIAIGSQKFETGHVPHSANPDWNWIHDFKVGGRGSEFLELEVWDHDSAWNFWTDGHDKISDLDVDFRALTPNENVEFSKKLKNSKGKDAGVIKFEVKWVPDTSSLVSVEIGKHGNQLLSHREEPSLKDGTADCPEALYAFDTHGKCRTGHSTPPGLLDEYAKKECCEASEKAKAAKASLASGTADAALASGTVHLYVKGARGLPDMDPSWGSGHTDAFVKIAIGSQKFETGHVPHSANPDWNWIHDFKVGGRGSEMLEFEVWDHDSAWNFWTDGHDKISDLDVDFRALPPNENVVFSEKLKNSKGKDAGVIKFEVKWVPDR
jgi:Ca2+-dependent lipid-binding protein